MMIFGLLQTPPVLVVRLNLIQLHDGILSFLTARMHSTTPLFQNAIGRISMPVYLVFFQVAKKACSLPCVVQTCSLCLKLATGDGATKKFFLVVLHIDKIFALT